MGNPTRSGCCLPPTATMSREASPPTSPATAAGTHHPNLSFFSSASHLVAAEEVGRCRSGEVAMVGLDFASCDEAIVEKAWHCFGGLDAFVNCYCYEGEIQDCLNVSEDEYKKTIKVNVMTPWFLLKATAKRFRDSKSGGSVILLTQIIGAERGSYPGAAAYGSSLASIHQLVKSSTLFSAVSNGAWQAQDKSECSISWFAFAQVPSMWGRRRLRRQLGR